MACPNDIGALSSMLLLLTIDEKIPRLTIKPLTQQLQISEWQASNAIVQQSVDRGARCTTSLDDAPGRGELLVHRGACGGQLA